ncbi:hypothetical protein DMH04_09095 [Kibdelosporangium aridum]|uniref:Uncharacterized protein n=1 Tax=Kibdelosporangium aridum TaxID=2030 RepID=A0A428ZIJ8_KIBAR|nr:DUF5825 family protein [Kibdelosporangium aridum]RSM87874.1 hypothetical protein DMH04_09095 [Kibdelosporangium aridum]
MKHWPEVKVLDAIPSDDASADWDCQRLRLRAPLKFGTDPAQDAAALRFLVSAAERYVKIEWHLAGELPWRLHTVVHLPPPATGGEIARKWRELFRLALCTYRYGPDFVLLRDNRPGKDRFRGHLGADWVRPFRDLVAGTGADKRLLDELVAADLAIRLGDGEHVVLATRLRRWPVPHFTV